jgi:serine/threonine protein kinase
VKAPFSFTEKDSQIFVMEFMPGGDLRQLLNEEVYFEEEAARFYLAEMVMAIEHLHNFSIIHRDLKPENLVIDEEGHIKLTDFGLSAMAIK